MAISSITLVHLIFSRSRLIRSSYSIDLERVDQNQHGNAFACGSSSHSRESQSDSKTSSGQVRTASVRLVFPSEPSAAPGSVEAINNRAKGGKEFTYFRPAPITRGLHVGTRCIRKYRPQSINLRPLLIKEPLQLYPLWALSPKWGV